MLLTPVPLAVRGEGEPEQQASGRLKPCLKAAPRNRPAPVGEIVAPIGDTASDAVLSLNVVSIHTPWNASRFSLPSQWAVWYTDGAARRPFRPGFTLQSHDRHARDVMVCPECADGGASSGVYGEV